MSDAAPPTADEHLADRHTMARIATIVATAAAVLVGLALIVTAATLGRCDAFGGRCPSERPALWDDDVFGMAAFGTALIVVVPVHLHRPSWRRLGLAVTAGAVAALAVGVLVRNIAHG